MTVPFKNASLAISNALRDRKIVDMAKVFEPVLRVTLILTIALILSLDAYNFLMLLSISGFCVGAFLHWSQRALLGTVLRSNIRIVLLDLFSFSWPLFVWSQFGWLQQMSNRWLLESFNSLQDVANLAYCHQSQHLRLP